MIQTALKISVGSIFIAKSRNFFLRNLFHDLYNLQNIYSYDIHRIRHEYNGLLEKHEVKLMQ